MYSFLKIYGVFNVSKFLKKIFSNLIRKMKLNYSIVKYDFRFKKNYVTFSNYFYFLLFKCVISKFKNCKSAF